MNTERLRDNGDFLPSMLQEAADLKDLAASCDRPGQGELIRRYAEGYEAACCAISDLRAESQRMAAWINQARVILLHASVECYKIADGNAASKENCEVIAHEARLLYDSSKFAIDGDDRLREAAIQALAWIEADEQTHGRKFGCGNVLRHALNRL